MNTDAHDLGSIIIAVRAVVPTSKLALFENILYRAPTAACASDDFRIAVGVELRSEPPGPRKFGIIEGGAA